MHIDGKISSSLGIFPLIAEYIPMRGRIIAAEIVLKPTMTKPRKNPSNKSISVDSAVLKSFLLRVTI